MKYLHLIGFFALITLVSCNKQKEELVKITPDLLNCCYKTNSYWVYIDTVSNDVDSVYVDGYIHDIYERDFVTDYTITNSEYFIYTTKSSSKSAMFKIQHDCLEKNFDNSAIITIYCDYNGPAFEHLDSTFIYDRYYYRVLRVLVEEDGTEDNNTSIYYTNSDYGILRHDIYSDTVLLSSKVLMRKNIVR